MLPPRNEDEPRRGPHICTIGRTPYMCHIRQSSLLHPLFSFVCSLQKHGLDGPKSTDCGREGGDERTRSSQSISQTPFSCFRHHPFYSQPSPPLHGVQIFSFSPPPLPPLPDARADRQQRQLQFVAGMGRVEEGEKGWCASVEKKAV